MDFVTTTRQVVATTPRTEVQFAINKAVFAKSVSLGRVTKPLRAIHNRVEKYICKESCLLTIVWDRVTVGVRERGDV